jgi:hypothetical protein
VFTAKVQMNQMDDAETLRRLKEEINLPAIEINTGTLNPSLGPDPMFSINKGAKRNQQSKADYCPGKNQG